MSSVTRSRPASAPSRTRSCAASRLAPSRTPRGWYVQAPGDPDAYAAGFAAACAAAGVPCEERPVGEVLAREPGLHPALQRAFAVRDAALEPWELIEANLADAVAHGAEVRRYVRVTAIERAGRRLLSVTLADERSGSVERIVPRLVVSAAGAWAGGVAALAGVPLRILPGKGTMLVFAERLSDAVINRCHPPGDGDLMVPVHTVSILGTTDVQVRDPDDTAVERAEVAALLDEGERLFPSLRERRVLRAYAGVRPLYEPPADDADGAGASAPPGGRMIRRSHVVIDHAAQDGVDDFVSIVGGKLTTYRLMAEQTVDLVMRKLGTSARCTTADEALPGQEPRRNHWLGARLAAHEAAGGGDADLICECELVTRAGAGRLPRRALALLARRRPTWHAAGHGSLPGRLLHLPRGRRDRRTRGPPGRLAGGRGRPRRHVGRGVPGGAPEGTAGRRLGPPAAGGAPRRGALPRHAGPPARIGSGRPRRRWPMPSADVVVVGSGLAGLSTAIRLAEDGARVVVVAAGSATLSWAGGPLDVAAVPPDGTPREGVANLTARPGHPYAVLADDIEAAVAWFGETMARGGLPYEGDLDRPLRPLPTALGATRPAAIVPAGMAAALEPWRPDESLVVMGIQGDKDLWPAAVAAGLRQAFGAGPRSWPGLHHGRHRGHPRPRRPAQPLRPGPGAPVRRPAPARRPPGPSRPGRWTTGPSGGRRVALPAALGLDDHAAVLAEARDALGGPVFELPMVPPSIPGLRLQAVLRRRFLALGGRILLGEAVARVELDAERVARVILPAAAREMTIRAPALVLATGGLTGGGLVAPPSGGLRETVLGLPVEAPPEADWLAHRADAPGGTPDRPGRHPHRPAAATGRARTACGSWAACWPDSATSTSAAATAWPWRAPGARPHHCARKPARRCGSAAHRRERAAA